MGVTVYQRTDKPHLGWWVLICQRGKRKKMHVGDKREAEKLAKRLRYDVALNRIDLGKQEEARPLLGPYFKDWLRTHARVHCKESTAAGYEIAFRLYVEPELGNQDIRQITRANVRELANKMIESGKSRAYTKATLAPLCAVLNRAIEDGILTNNPAIRALPKTRFDKAEKEADFLIRVELTHLLETCQQHFPAHYPFVLLLARTGLRIGEAVVLQWDDLDFDDRFIEVRRNYVDGKITTTKPGKRRRVDMSRQLAEVLKERKEKASGRGWIFTTKVGTHLNPDNFRKRAWGRLVAKASMRPVTPHVLRHTFASLLIQQGAPLAYIKDQLGHQSIRITVDTYGHLVPGGHIEEIDKLDDPNFSPPSVPLKATQAHVVL